MKIAIYSPCRLTNLVWSHVAHKVLDRLGNTTKISTNFPLEIKEFAAKEKQELDILFLQRTKGNANLVWENFNKPGFAPWGSNGVG